MSGVDWDNLGEVTHDRGTDIDPSITTVEDQQRLGFMAMELKAKLEVHKDEGKRLNEQYREVEAKILLHLNEFDCDKLQTPGGTISITRRTSYKVPKEPDKREAYFEFLKSKGVYEAMISVNSQTMNAHAKEEFENAKSEGNYDFEIPGLGEPTVTEGIRIAKKKG